MQEVNNQ